MKEFTKAEVRQVMPVALLRSQGWAYWMLSALPVDPDWEGQRAFRFTVVPLANPEDKVHLQKGIIRIEPGQEQTVYSHARHLVTTDFSVEYTSNVGPIWVEKLEPALEVN
jgi:hypothetical protein